MALLRSKIVSRAPVGAKRVTLVRAPIKVKPPPPVIKKSGPLAKRAIGNVKQFQANKVLIRHKPRPKGAGDLGSGIPSPGSGKKIGKQQFDEPAPATAEQSPAEPERYLQPEPATSAPAEEVQQEEYAEEEYEEEPVEEGESYDSATEGGNTQPESQSAVSPASSHVHNGIMHTAVIACTPSGCNVVITRVKAENADQDGLVNFNGDNPEWLEKAIQKTNIAVYKKLKSEAPKKHIASLVNRARAGDQNAMAIISLASQRAKAGDETAKRSVALMHDYIRDNPATGEMGFELAAAKPSRDKLRAMIVFANGPPLNNQRLNVLLQQLPSDNHRQLFSYGISNFRTTKDTKMAEKKLDAFSKTVLDLGQTIGEARAVQMVRLPNSSISKFNPMIGWELGE